MNTTTENTTQENRAEVTVAIPTPLRAYTKNQKRVKVVGNTVSEVLSDLVQRYPMLRPYIMEGDEVMDFVNIYVNNTDVRDLAQKFETTITENDMISIIPSIAGGKS